MILFHGSPSTTAPIIGVGDFALGVFDNNLFDGIFSSYEYDAAASHCYNGNGRVFSYEVDGDKIASSSDLDARFQEVYDFLRDELSLDADYDVSEIADRVMWDNGRDIEDFADILSPRMDIEVPGAYSWELQRLRGRVAAHLGFDAVEMEDEHGTSYLIVNPSIKAV